MLSSRAGDRVWIQTETTAELIAVGLQTSGRPDATDGPPLHGDRHALGKTSPRPPSGAGGPTGALLAARLGTGAAVGSGRPAGALIRSRLIRSQRPKKPVRVEFGYRGHHHTERPRLGHRTGQQPAGTLVAAPKIVGQRNIAQCDSRGDLLERLRDQRPHDENPGLYTLDRPTLLPLHADRPRLGPAPITRRHYPPRRPTASRLRTRRSPSVTCPVSQTAAATRRGHRRDDPVPPAGGTGSPVRGCRRPRSTLGGRRFDCGRWHAASHHPGFGSRSPSRVMR